MNIKHFKQYLYFKVPSFFLKGKIWMEKLPFVMDIRKPLNFEMGLWCKKAIQKVLRKYKNIRIFVQESKAGLYNSPLLPNSWKNYYFSPSCGKSIEVNMKMSKNLPNAKVKAVAQRYQIIKNKQSIFWLFWLFFGHFWL